MENPLSLIDKLLGRIILEKTQFFGLDTSKINLVVTPSLKIAKISATPKRLVKKFPFEERRILNAEQLKEWAKENDYNISFFAVIPEMKKKLLLKFGDVMVESVEEQKHSTTLVLEELEKTNLPESIKNWAIENPEKFIKNLEYIKKLLGK